MVDHPLPNLCPKSVPMVLEVCSLGIRNLVSILGVHKPRIEFDAPNGKRYRTDKSARPSTRNPNFLQILSIPISVPLDPKFAPSLNLSVIDCILGGFVKRRIGVSSILLEKYIEHDSDLDWSDRKVPVIGEAELQKQITQLQAQLPQRRSTTLQIKSETLAPPSRTNSKANIPIVEELDDDPVPLLVEVVRDCHSVEWGEKIESIEEIPEYRKERNQIETELEDYMVIKPFDEVAVQTGSKKSGIFGPSLRKVGLYKGIIRLSSSKDSMTSLEMKEILSPKDVFVRLYVL
jgi:hypothetical protein